MSAPTRSPAKSTIAIGTGSKLGLVMSMVSCARAGAGGRGSECGAAQDRPRRRGSIMSNLFFIEGVFL